MRTFFYTLFLLIPFSLLSQQTKTVTSSAGYQVHITLSPVTIVAQNNGCTNGVYNVSIPYTISFTPNTNPGLYALQANIDCIGTNNIFFDLPNGGGTGTAISSNASTSNGNCGNITCSTIEVLVDGPGINTTVLFSVTKLPLVLLNFDLDARENKIVLNWSVDKVEKFKKFELIKSYDGLHWTQLALIDYEDKKQKYFFTDYNPKRKQYYQLKMHDANGQIEYSNLISNLFTLKNNEVTLYPNPTTGLLRLDNTTSGSMITVYNQAGTVLTNFKSSDKFTVIDLSSYPKGFYILRHNDMAKKIILF